MKSQGSVIIRIRNQKVQNMLIDTHAHLDFPEFSNDLPSVLNRAMQKGVQRIITIGINLASSQQVIDLAHRYPQVYATVGIHPHDAFLMDEEALSIFRSLAREDRVLAIGETGLDYHRDRQPRAIQRKCLNRQLEVACDLKLPVVFHIREAFDDFFDIVRPYAHSLGGGVLHCFSGDWNIAVKALDLGFYLSIPGTVTFPQASKQQDVVKKAPFDRLLVETDAPYLTPVPFRGKVNEPSYVYYTAKKVAEIRGCTLDEVASQTTSNACAVFHLNDSSTPRSDNES